MLHEKDGGCNGTKGGGCGESETWGREGEEIRDRKDEYYDEAMVHEGGERRRKEVMDAVRGGSNSTTAGPCSAGHRTGALHDTFRPSAPRREEKSARAQREGETED